MKKRWILRAVAHCCEGSCMKPPTNFVGGVLIQKQSLIAKQLNTTFLTIVKKVVFSYEYNIYNIKSLNLEHGK